VSLASSEEFDKAGLDRPFLLTKFKFEVVVTNGQTKILVTSKEAVKEPFLDFLLIATTGKGRLLREYTVLLDPPEFVLQETGLAAKPAALSSSNQTTTSSTTTSTNKTSNTTSYRYASDTYEVQKLDTLWDVALKTKPSSDISVHQMMLALVDANPSAFRDQNINGLKAGTTLDIPAVDVIESRTLAQALAEVKQHNTQWKNRNKPAANTRQAVATNNSASTATTDTESTETTATTESSESEQVETEAKLNLLTPEELETSNQDASTSTMGSSNVEKLAEQLTLAQETIEAQSQENVDLQQRMEALEDQIETLRRMISIKDADMARLQDVLGEDAEQ
jgi:pilus assembly protein FimV